MKKILIFLVVILSVYIIYNLYEGYLNSNDKEVFVKRTGISKFELTSHVRKERYFYMIAKISPADKKMMLKKHYFKSPPVDLKGNFSYELPNVKEDDYLYYLDDTGNGYLGYVLYLISKKDNQLIMYTHYAD